MATSLGRLRLTAAESFWYVLGCIAFGGMYFAKVPVKKALSEAGLAEMTSAEQFWYVLQCVAFGAGYFAKVPVKKALTETAQLRDPGYGGLRPGAAALPQAEQGYRPGVWDGLQAGPSHALPAPRRHARHGGRG
jgi:hypothetical protein